MLHNAVGGGRVSDFPGKNVTKMYGSTLLALRGGGSVSNLQKKSVTQHLNGPLRTVTDRFKENYIYYLKGGGARVLLTNYVAVVCPHLLERQSTCVR